MPDRPTPHSSFTVSSGYVCFGDLRNIWDGASAPVQQLPDLPPEPVDSETVRTVRIEYNCNMAAKNGEWHVFELTSSETSTTRAWLVAHEDVDPMAEMHRLMRVSGQQGHIDSASSDNDALPFKGVLVLDRYNYNRRYDDERSADEGVFLKELDDLSAVGVGIVDRGGAKDAVFKWKTEPSAKREPTAHGVWVYLPGAAHRSGAFGYDEAHAAARSFVFFDLLIEFTETSFAGSAQTLLPKETLKERFERELKEGDDFSGLGWLHFAIHFIRPVPLTSEPLGPYDPSEHILTTEDMDVVMPWPSIAQPFDKPEYAEELDDAVKPLFELWRQSVYDLLNEMIMSYLERVVVPNMSNRGLADAAEALYPRTGPDKKRTELDQACFTFFTDHKLPFPDWDLVGIAERIKAFLTRLGGASATYDDECVAGIARVVVYLLAKTVDAANRRRCMSEQFRITPEAVRHGVFDYYELFDYFALSRVYLVGRGEWQCSDSDTSCCSSV